MVRLPAIQRGFTYLLVLVLVAALGFALAGAGTVWKTDMQRMQESQLLFIGNQYRQAIQSYYERYPASPRLPVSVEELLQDNRDAGTVRHLRRAWQDPIAGQPFELIPAEEGPGFTGVASSSSLAPLKKTGFDPQDKDFEKATVYSQWQFLFRAGALAVPPANTTNETDGHP
jgi:type II secretory pathway pseudopilin PulG